MSQRSLSANMAAALALAFEHGGKLERQAGGYWTYPGCPHRRLTAARPTGDWYVGATTVEALVDRKRMRFTEYKEARGTRMPIVAEVVS